MHEIIRLQNLKKYKIYKIYQWWNRTTCRNIWRTRISFLSRSFSSSSECLTSRQYGKRIPLANKSKHTRMYQKPNKHAKRWKTTWRTLEYMTKIFLSFTTLQRLKQNKHTKQFLILLTTQEISVHLKMFWLCTASLDKVLNHRELGICSTMNLTNKRPSTRCLLLKRSFACWEINLTIYIRLASLLVLASTLKKKSASLIRTLSRKSNRSQLIEIMTLKQQSVL